MSQLLDALPDRRLTEQEAKSLNDASGIDDVEIKGRHLNTAPYTVEALTVTVEDTTHELFCGLDGWQVLDDGDAVSKERYS